MNTRLALALALSLVLAAPAALAQTGSDGFSGSITDLDGPARAASPHRAAPPAHEQAPAPDAVDDLPALPEPPEQLADRVAALRTIAFNATACWSYHGERSEHAASPRCPAWLARLAHGRAAAVYAIGQMLDSNTADDRFEDGDHSLSETSDRLLEIMAATRAPEAVPYLLVYAYHQSHQGAGSSVESTLRLLVEFSGNNPAPTEPWNYDAAHSAPLVQAWLRWYREHRAETRDQWLQAGRAQARETLASDAVPVRFAAIERLINLPGDRPAATTALRALLARPDLTADTRTYLRRYARRNHVASPASAAASPRTASAD